MARTKMVRLEGRRANPPVDPTNPHPRRGPARRFDRYDRMGNRIGGRVRPPAGGANPRNGTMMVLRRFFRYDHMGNRIGSSEHFPIEIPDSDGDDNDSTGASARLPIEIDDNDSDTDGNPTEQSVGEVTEEK